jgi:alkanesulfonate monooxygenase SsuD/methylene tetrahydromethanopterin reductase-like flavin-dependent oxidoreductase (luciferase family)
MKRIGFLSFGHWGDVPGSRVRSARDALLQAIELAVAAEEVGVDGAFFRLKASASAVFLPPWLLAAALSPAAWAAAVALIADAARTIAAAAVRMPRVRVVLIGSLSRLDLNRTRDTISRQ